MAAAEPEVNRIVSLVSQDASSLLNARRRVENYWNRLESAGFVKGVLSVLSKLGWLGIPLSTSLSLCVATYLPMVETEYTRGMTKRRTRRLRKAIVDQACGVAWHSLEQAVSLFKLLFMRFDPFGATLL